MTITSNSTEADAPEDHNVRPSPPSGDVTFLFTDIQGSTKLWETFPQAMAIALARHDAIMRAAISAHHGYVFKTIGDAFCAAFPTASDGVNAALDAQRALINEPWGETGPIKVRMALHTGVPELRDSDYFGQPVNRVARLLATGHGGQVLASTSTRAQLEPGSLEAGVILRDLGRQRLKDLAHPETVYQLVAADLPAIFPKLKTPPRPFTGVLLSVATFLAGLAIFRVTTAQTLSLSIFNPVTMFDSFKRMVLELSTYQEFFLLGMAALLLLLTFGSAWIWKRNTEYRPGVRVDGAVGFLGTFVSLRTTTFFASFFVIFLGAYLYQQYLWRVALPIPDDALGIALTREASAASVRDELADALFAEGQTERVVIRELPVRFNAADTDEARAVGKRIGARAVIIYREQERDGKKEHVAYVVFTDPAIGLSVSGGEGPAEDDVTLAADLNEGVAVPALKASTVSELVGAAAGIIAYHNGDYAEAITRLEAAGNQDTADGGIVNFYLGSAYDHESRDDDAIAAFDRSIAYYENRTASGARLGPQDQLVLARAYSGRGRIENHRDNSDAAIAWYEKAIGLREELLARADDLERPGDVHTTFARTFAELGDMYRLKGDVEEATFWSQRARDEAAEIGDDESDPQALNKRGLAQFFAGDCGAAVSTLERAIERDPNNIDALNNLATFHLLQGDWDDAQTGFERILAIEPDNTTAREQIAFGFIMRAIGSDDYYEPFYLTEAERVFADILADDPTNREARDQLADLASWRSTAARIDTNATVIGDALTTTKSQTLWDADPEKRQDALSAIGDLIEQRRIIATELHPGSIPEQVDLAAAYVERLNLIYYALPSIEASDGRVEVQRMGDHLLADAAEVHEWTAAALADDSSGTKLDRLEAYGHQLKALELEWSWHAIYSSYQRAEDQPKSEARADELEATFRATTEAAIASIEADAPETPDEQRAAANAYYAQAIIALLIDKDGDKSQSALETFTSLMLGSAASDAAGTQHRGTTCAEAQELREGQKLAEAGDVAGAISHYETALAINPDHVPTLRAYGLALFAEGDTLEAIDRVSRATDLEPSDALSWSDLGRYSLVAGDAARRDAAYERFLTAIEGRPAFERMGLLRLTLADLQALSADQPELGADISALLPHFESFLNDIGADSEGTYAYPNLFTDLARLALFVDEPAQAEALYLRAVELDAHQPFAYAGLALAAFAQHRDGRTELDALSTELSDALWEEIDGVDGFGRDDLSDLIGAEVTRYTDRFPDRAKDGEQVRTVIH